MQTGNNNSNVPAWIADMARKNQVRELQAQRQRYEQLADSMLVAKHGPILWKELGLQLERQAAGVAAIGVRAKFSSSVTNGEEQYRIDADLASTLRPRPTYTTLFYSASQLCVRSRTQEDIAETYPFAITDQTVGLVMQEFAPAMDAERVAERIVKAIVARVLR